MKANLRKEPAKFDTILDIVVTGWTVGVSAIFLPIIALAIIVSLLSDGPFTKDVGIGIVSFFLVPIIAFIQSLMVTLIIYLGLRLYKWPYSRNKTKP
jgi:hypothetical protein